MAASGADYTGISHVYPSPERDEDESQPSEQQKPAAKRKRENRYKNAPPSVLSVCHNPSKARSRRRSSNLARPALPHTRWTNWV
jgi:hypothetical protein